MTGRPLPEIAYRNVPTFKASDRRRRGGSRQGSVSNFVFKAVLIRPGLLRQGEKNRLIVPSPG